MERLSNTLLSWASILDDQTREQALRISRLPIIYPHVALMPDAHLGKGATVGSVVPTHRAVIPAAVGVDIGCGMLAVRTNLSAEDSNFPAYDLARLRELIQNAVPMSAGGYNQHITNTAARRVMELKDQAIAASFDPEDYAGNWQYQLGSLGSGNHFIEISTDESWYVWAFIHSGSRGVGNKIAQRHIAVARHFHEVQGTALEDPDLAWLVEGTPEFARYINEMEWAQRFAWVNRQEMMDRVFWALELWTNQPVQRLDAIHCHHNYTTREMHNGRVVWLTRKGAIAAHEGARGLIPGSMATESYVVTGRGNRESLSSAPHGAGRVHSRRSARNTFTVQQLEDRMGLVEYDRTRAERFIDEIPDAYKPIERVMRDAEGLVRVEHTLRQLISVKGD